MNVPEELSAGEEELTATRCVGRHQSQQRELAGDGQQLLGRISELDPQASHALRVIACFDELCIGGVEREGKPGANDAIILERLALSVRIRHARGPRDIDGRRHMGLLLDSEVPLEERRLPR